VDVDVAVAVADSISTFPKPTKEVSMPSPLPSLNHEKLHVYQASIEFLVLTEQTIEHLQRGNSPLIDQLRRAAMSVPLNIAEGYGKRRPADRGRFYDIARGSAHECGAVLDVLQARSLIGDASYRENKALLHRIVSMLVKLVRS